MLYQTEIPNQPSRPKPVGLIVLFALAGLLIFSALVAIGVYFGLNQVKDNGPIPVRYYMALRDQNYALAYSYLSSDAKINDQQIDLQSFTRQAALADAGSGRVEGFTIEGEQTNPAGITIQLHRSNQKYTVHLQVKQVAGKLQIVSASGI